jgi:hypothetical protein
MTVRRNTQSPAPSGGPHAKRNFILQQGLCEPAAATCSHHYAALLFQPRLIGLAVVAGVITQAPLVFFILVAALWWSAFVPRLNPFDALYNFTSARRTGIALTPAPAPRRFSQFLAGAFALAIGISLTLGWRTLALILEGFFIVAVAAVALFGFCLGSLIFHLLRGRADFARRTLPWATGAPLK